MRAKGRKPSRPAAAEVVEVAIDALGARGDGIGRHDGQPVFVPLAAPGDRLRVAIGAPRGDGTAGALVEVLAPSPFRRAPACGHFGECGGCAVQHVADEVYAAWKRDLVVAALAHRGLRDVEVRPPVRVPPGTRRRVTLGAARHGGRVRLGFSARAAHRIIDLRECVVAAPDIVALLAPLRAALAAVLGEGEHAEVLVTLCDTGADLLLVSSRAPDLAAREALAAFAEAQDAARVSWRCEGHTEAEPIAWRRSARVSFGGVAVEPPPGAFLQPTAAGESALVAMVVEALAGSPRVADLFAGCGAFSFPLATAGAVVHAVEGEAACVAAIRAAAGRTQRADRVTAEARDLERRPLQPGELARCSGVVFDPPRAGARAQSDVLARAAVETVVAVSCNPATFARDARVLVDGGFRLGPVTPVDQFLWSAHVELVAVFRRC